MVGETTHRITVALKAPVGAGLKLQPRATKGFFVFDKQRTYLLFVIPPSFWMAP
jgi:hypothetical protein